MTSFMSIALFSKFRCVRAAAFGKPVVPEVNWMLVMSVFRWFSMFSSTASRLQDEGLR